MLDWIGGAGCIADVDCIAAGMDWLPLSRGARTLASEAVTLAKAIALTTQTTANMVAAAPKARTAFLKASDDTTFLSPDCSASSKGPARKRGAGSFSM